MMITISFIKVGTSLDQFLCKDNAYLYIYIYETFLRVAIVSLWQYTTAMGK